MGESLSKQIHGQQMATQHSLPLWEEDEVSEGIIGEYGVCRMAYSQLRTEPGDVFEQEAQLTFGEAYRVKAISSDKKWVQIERPCDGTVAWMEEHRHRRSVISTADFDSLKAGAYSFVASRSFEICDERERTIQIPVGGVLPFYDSSSQVCRVSDTSYRVVRGEVFVGIQEPKVDTLVRFLKLFDGVVYEWGGETSFGADCSGLVRVVLRVFGYDMPRNSGP